ncbi:MAG: asparagine synthase, partial [Magnetospirillum sp.]
EPRIGQSYPNFYAAKLASSFGRVVLSGTGGDELFGGYPWRYHRGMGDGGFQQWVDRYYAYWQRLLPNGLLPQVMAPVWDKVGHVDCRQLFCGVFDGTGFEAPTSPEDCVGLSMYLEAKTFLHGLLVVEDKLSMAHGLENRLPFLDNDVVDFALALPTDRKLKLLDSKIRIDENLPGSKTDHYFSKTKDGKLLLRQAFASLLPEETANGPKQGFSGPDASWFRGESLEFVRRIIFDDRSAIFDVLDPAAVRPLVSDHLAGTENRRLLLWSLLSLEQWCRTFLGRGP